MPVGLIDHGDDSRQRIYELGERINELAEVIRALRARAGRLRQRLRELEGRYVHILEAAGRYVVGAVQAVVLFLASWIVDYIILSPLSDFMLRWAKVPEHVHIHFRLAFAFMWTLIGYALGFKVATGRMSRQPAARWDLIPAVCYALAVPTNAYFVSAQIFTGPQRFILLPFALVLSSVPIFSGWYVATSVECLAVKLYRGLLKRREGALERAEMGRGRELVRYAYRLAVAQDEHYRRFREWVQPHLTDLARQLIEEFSRGGVTVSTQADQAGLSEREPLSLPEEGNGDGAVRGVRESDGGGATGLSLGSASGNGRRPHEHVPGDAESELEFLRQQLARRAEVEDSELRPPAEFSSRLP